MQQKFEEHAHTFHLKVCKLAVSFVGTLSSLHVETLGGFCWFAEFQFSTFHLGLTFQISWEALRLLEWVGPVEV